MSDPCDRPVWRSGIDSGRRFGRAPSAEIAIKDARRSAGHRRLVEASSSQDVTGSVP
jgi:hypothetical protein